MKKKRGNETKVYIVIVDNSGFDSETTIEFLTKEKIKEKYQKDQTGICIIDGQVIKSFDNKIDLTRL